MITEKAAKNTADKIWISFKLRKYENCTLYFYNPFFESQALKFSNDSDHDTVITKEVNSTKAISWSYQFIESIKEAHVQIVRYVLLAQPADTIHLAYNVIPFLNLDECKKRNIIAGNDTSFYTNERFIPINKVAAKDESWQYFNIYFEKKYNQEITRINNLLSTAQIDSVSYHQFLVSCQLHYYKRYIDWVWQGDGKYFKPAVAVLTANLSQIEKTINEQDILTTDLLAVIDGFVRVKLINKGKDNSNEINVYNEASVSNLGKAKSVYLTVCIVKSPIKKGPAFAGILNNYKNRYKNTIYLPYVDSVLNSILEDKRIYGKDSLITLTKAVTKWDDLGKSKKRFLVIDFWASWCSPCRAQLPYIDSLKSVMKGYPVEFISINIDKNTEDWKTASKAEAKYLKGNNYHLVTPESRLLYMI
ncbi:TlpA family protein disulfide reductase [Mucilaginibacter sp. SP1R1]|uniref:TlpA family protein disulfide reductase n=1 Tax=Mucilaginibacter sp. SP1R1 TaxID=2723091 RepID=UPI003AFFBE6B